MPTLSFKVAPAEEHRIRAAAKARRLSVSEYLRRAALPPAKSQPKLRMKTDRRTGLSYAVMPSGAPRLGLHDVKRILADFP
jgi:hypothetical protein